MLRFRLIMLLVLGQGALLACNKPWENAYEEAHDACVEADDARTACYEDAGRDGYHLDCSMWGVDQSVTTKCELKYDAQVQFCEAEAWDNGSCDLEEDFEATQAVVRACGEADPEFCW